MHYHLNKITGHELFAIFGKLIEVYIKKKNIHSMGYPSVVIIRRFMQIFYQLEGREISKKSLEYTENKNLLDMHLKRFSCRVKDGSISISFSYFVKSILKFWHQWFSVLYASLIALFYDKRENKKYTLVYGVHEVFFSSNKKELEFINFCKTSNIKPLSESEYFIIESQENRKSSNFKNIVYSDNPLYYLLKNSEMSINTFMHFFFTHCRTVFGYFKLVFNLPAMAILDSDFSYHALVLYLNKHLIKEVLITNSNTQPLWMANLPGRNFKLHMVWYSQSTFGHHFTPRMKDNNPTHFKYIEADEFWVWTKGFSKLLRRMGIKGIFHHVGPILFYSPNYVKKIV